MDLVVAGTARRGDDGRESEIKELGEDEVLGGGDVRPPAIQPVIEAIIELAEHSAKEPFDFAVDDTDAVKAEANEADRRRPRGGLQDLAKGARHDAVEAAREPRRWPRSASRTPIRRASSRPSSATCSRSCEADVVRRNILDTGMRIDGRTVDKVRPIVSEVGVLPRAHGSALFTRGETQALVVATLGTGDDEQLIDALEGKYKEAFMLHYNFPPYSVGETGRMGAPSRREIGHGKLAWRAIRPMLPSRGGVPLHDPPGLGDHRVQRLVVDGDGLRLLAGADGRGRAAEEAGQRHRHGPDPGKGRLRGALRHPRRRGPPRRHGLQGRRHRRRHHLAADGHQDPRHHRGRS